MILLNLKSTRITQIMYVNILAKVRDRRYYKVQGINTEMHPQMLIHLIDASALSNYTKLRTWITYLLHLNHLHQPLCMKKARSESYVLLNILLYQYFINFELCNIIT